MHVPTTCPVCGFTEGTVECVRNVAHGDRLRTVMDEATAATNAASKAIASKAMLMLSKMRQPTHADPPGFPRNRAERRAAAKRRSR